MEEVVLTPSVVSDVRVLEVSGFLTTCPRAWVSAYYIYKSYTPY